MLCSCCDRRITGVNPIALVRVGVLPLVLARSLLFPSHKYYADKLRPALFRSVLNDCRLVQCSVSCSFVSPAIPVGIAVLPDASGSMVSRGPHAPRRVLVEFERMVDDQHEEAGNSCAPNLILSLWTL